MSREAPVRTRRLSDVDVCGKTGTHRLWDCLKMKKRAAEKY